MAAGKELMAYSLWLMARTMPIADSIQRMARGNGYVRRRFGSLVGLVYRTREPNRPEKPNEQE